VRVRPLTPLELSRGARPCLSIPNPLEPQVQLAGGSRAFTYDHALGPHATQQEVYDACTGDLVGSVLDGYNATVLAYGQVR
jgi:hypothetical protein